MKDLNKLKQNSRFLFGASDGSNSGPDNQTCPVDVIFTNETQLSPNNVSTTDPSVAYFTNSNYVSIWTVISPTMLQLVAQQFYSNNTKLSNQLIVATHKWIGKTTVDVFSDNTFVVAWSTRDTTFGQWQIHTQRYNYSLGKYNLIGQELIVQSSHYNNGGFSLAILNTSFVLATTLNSTAIQILRYNSENVAPVFNQTQTTCRSTKFAIEVKILNVSAQSFFMIWSPLNAQGIFVQSYSFTNGTLIGKQKNNIGTNPIAVKVDAFADIGILIVWQNNTVCNGVHALQGIFAQLLDNDGNLLTAAQLSNETSSLSSVKMVPVANCTSLPPQSEYKTIPGNLCPITPAPPQAPISKLFVTQDKGSFLILCGIKTLIGSQVEVLKANFGFSKFNIENQGVGTKSFLDNSLQLYRTFSNYIVALGTTDETVTASTIVTRNECNEGLYRSMPNQIASNVVHPLVVYSSQSTYQTLWNTLSPDNIAVIFDGMIQPVETTPYIVKTGLQLFQFPALINSSIVSYSAYDVGHSNYTVSLQLMNNEQATGSLSTMLSPLYYEGSFTMDSFCGLVVVASMINISTMQITRFDKRPSSTNLPERAISQNVCIGLPMKMALKVSAVMDFFVLVHGSPANQVINIQCHKITDLSQIGTTQVINASFSNIELSVAKDHVIFAVAWQTIDSTGLQGPSYVQKYDSNCNPLQNSIPYQISSSSEGQLESIRIVDCNFLITAFARSNDILIKIFSSNSIWKMNGETPAIDTLQQSNPQDVDINYMTDFVLKELPDCESATFYTSWATDSGAFTTSYEMIRHQGDYDNC